MAAYMKYKAIGGGKQAIIRSDCCCPIADCQ